MTTRGFEDLLQRLQQRRHLGHKGEGGLFLIAAGLLFQPAGAAEAEQKAQRQQMRVPGGLLVLIPRPIGIQRQRLCHGGKVILRPGDGFRPGEAVIRRVAALLPQQKQQLRIISPGWAPRQRAEKLGADQFKQLHQKLPFFR